MCPRVHRGWGCRGTPVTILGCPVCHQPLPAADERTFRCGNGHAFDRARGGHVNVFRPGKARKERSGDDGEMIAARRSFLSRGHYEVLRGGVAALVAGLAPASVLDVGCGEGSFTAAMTAPGREVVAFDLSVAGVRLAARMLGASATCVVAGVPDMPAVAGSVGLVCSIMSPVHAESFRRVLAPGGHALVVQPGAAHLDGLRRTLYREYRPHDEELPALPGWPVVERLHLTAPIALESQTEILEVWGMTPYRWNAPAEGVEQLEALDRLDLTVDFVATVLAAPDT